MILLGDILLLLAIAVGKFSLCQNQQKCQTGSVICKITCVEEKR